MGKFGLCTYQDPEKISQPQVSDDKMETDGQKSLNNEKSDAETAAHTESGDKIQMDVYLEHKSGFGGLVVDLSGGFISKHYKDYCRDKARFATVNQQQGDPDVMQKAIGLFIQSVLCVYDVSVEVELQNELWEIVVHYQYNNNSDDGCCGRGGEGEDGEGEDGEDTGSEMSIQTTSVIFALLKNQLYESFRNNKPGILKQRRGLIELVYESCAEFTANNDLFTLVNLTLHASNSSGNLERRSEESGTVAIANSLGMNNSALNSLLFNATSVRNYLNKFNYQKILSEFSADTHSSTPKPVFMNSDTNGIVSDMYSNIYFIYASIQRDAIRVKKYSDPLRSAFEFASIINMCYINLHFNPKHWANWYVLGQSVLERVDYLLISGADSVSEMLPKPKTKSSSDGDTDKNNDTNTNTNTNADADLKSGTSTGTGTSMVTGKEPEKSRTFTQHLSLSSSSIEQSSLASNSTTAAAIAAEKTTSTSAFENKALEMYPETTTNCRSGKDKDKDKDDGKSKGKGNSSNNEDGNGDDDGDDDDDDEYPVRSYNIVWSYKVALLCFAQAIRLFESDAAIDTENCLPASISIPYELYYSTASLLYRMSSFPFNDNKSFSNILYSSVYNLVLKSKQQMLYSSTVPLFNQVSLELLLAKTLSKLNMKPEACLMFIKALYMGYKQPLLPGKPESGTGNILTGFTDLCIEPLVKFLATLTKLLLCDAICTCRAAKYISSLPGFPKIIEDNVDDASVSSQTSPDIRSRSFSGSFRGEAGKSNAGGSVIYKHDSVKNSNKEVYVISSDEGDDPPASPKKKQKLSHYTTKTSPKTKEQDSLCPQCRGNLIYSKKSVFTTILHLLEQMSVFDKKKTHHKYVFLQAYIYYHFFRDFVKARNSISNIVHLKLSGGRGLTSFYKTEMEFSGKFYYYAEKYALFAIKIIYNVSDSSAKAYSTSLDYYSWCQTFISGVDDFHTACKKVIVTENVFLNREIICNIARLYLYKLIVKKYKYVVNSCCTFFKLVPFYQSTNTAAIDDFQSTFFCGPMFLNIDKHKLDICHRSMLARIKRLLYIGKRSSAHSSLDNYFLSLYKQTYFLLLFLHRLFANIRKIPSNFNPQVFEQLPLNDPYFVYDVDLLSIDIYCRLLTFFGKSSPSYFITDGSLSSETSHDISGQDGPSLVELVDDFMLDLNNSSSHYQDSSTPDPELNSHQTTDNQKLWSFLLPGFHSTSTCPFYSTQSLFNYNRSPQQFSGDPSLNLNVHRTTSTYQKSPVSMFSTRMSQTYGEREELLLPNCLFLEFANLSNKLYALDFSTQQILINRPDMYLACCQKKYLASIDEGRLLKSKWITNIHSLVDIFDALKH
ncbi:hypothetical protein AX774_g575 [Zancudomyces culisetae]|uniref:Uncharacterized protein n=1 Tax=Zancudomyces culisetae TaxID=1213189 RepID=A0A1R1PY21_ZANCU|nr:hypothetical protein AX774_g575 [Zancudomyces culisetae]|eukprot:OMH85860.1 hypothetical protein AX774_g575 [Zancudomyces culisetae]